VRVHDLVVGASCTGVPCGARRRIECLGVASIGAVGGPLGIAARCAGWPRRGVSGESGEVVNPIGRLASSAPGRRRKSLVLCSPRGLAAGALYRARVGLLPPISLSIRPSCTAKARCEYGVQWACLAT
jgi:hypothetical protein